MKEEMSKQAIKNLIRSNLKIFKENLRTISLFSIDYVFESITADENLTNTILKRMNKGKFEEIEELEDENQKSSLNSTNKLDV